MFSTVSFSEFKKMMEQKVNQIIEVLSTNDNIMIEHQEKNEIENSEKINLLDTE